MQDNIMVSKKDNEFYIIPNICGSCGELNFNPIDDYCDKCMLSYYSVRIKDLKSILKKEIK